MVTGYPSLDTAVQSMKLDALDYLRKPFTVEEPAPSSTACSRRRPPARPRSSSTPRHRRDHPQPP